MNPKRKKGQSFLKSQAIARTIVDAANIQSGEAVLEIGGGLGILTSLLAQKAKIVFVIELEPGLAKALRDLLASNDNVEIIEGDALQVSWPKADKIVSNLPYSAASAITFRLLQKEPFEEAILMYQKEFAQRLLATPGSSEYSRLSIDFQYLGNAEHIMDVDARNFYPTPEVNSSVLRVVHRKTGPFARSDEVFFWMIHGLFSYPNKQLRKALGIWLKNIGQAHLTDTLLEGQRAVDGSVRLRDLSLEELVILSDLLLDFIEKGILLDPRR
ncbi:MAG: 16S rRNA (adenine(1518)-N(6)/adenine(1519)-N(6))-dimethyltransferase RsmA [Candidatus Thorarchaeota archaeon]